MSKPKDKKQERPKCSTCNGGGVVFGFDNQMTAVGLPGIKTCPACGGSGKR